VLRASLLRIAMLLAIFIAGAHCAFAHPGATIAVGADGVVYFVDTGAGVFSVDAKGQLVRRDGPAFHWFAFDPAGRFRQTRWPSIPGAEFRAAGVRPTLVLSSDYPVAIGTDGIFYYPQGSRERGVRIVGIAPSGTQSVRATLPLLQSGGQPAWWLNGLAAGPAGSLYYTEDRAVRRIDARGRVTVVANVPAVPNCMAIPGIGRELRPYLRGLAVAADGTLYVAASGCGALLKIERGGKTSVVLRTQSPWSPTAVAIANGEVYVLEYSHTASDDRREWLPRVRKITRTGAVVTLGGNTRLPVR
jgi:hypothetical protein